MENTQIANTNNSPHPNVLRRKLMDAGERKRILIVDDDPDLLDTLCYRMEARGYEVSRAVTGLEAIRRIRSEMPDLVILDVMLPGENGYRVSRLLKGEDRLTALIPILLLTARDLSNDPDREAMFLRFSRADAMLYKPFDMPVLLDTVSTLVGRHCSGTYCEKQVS